MGLFGLELLLALVETGAGVGVQQRTEPASDVGPSEFAAGKSVASPAFVEGADLSKWQGVADFSQWKAAGKAFVFLKATEGATGVDPDHQRNAQAARAAGLLVGSYHYYLPADTGDAQFANLSRQAPPTAGDLPPVIDIEVLSKSGPIELATQLRPFLQMIELQYGVRPIIYSGKNFAAAHLRDLSTYPLWLAEYNGAASPQMPPDWSRWTFWQYTDSGAIVGVNGKVDLDRFNGTLQGLKAMLQRGVPSSNRIGP